ncbi:hypothetical protein LTS18_001815 [Coniosporium uncinatum]|uniref:Uncharacterized protein n=1 Tax=Coniosporium uncinatum TaxID=93489 RepID=A0ACC3DEL7_9PEZI|nr:hypothetical protein LTS18_001815 [Coniosporium uncinatum]
MTGENADMGQFNAGEMTDTDFSNALTQHNNGDAHPNGGGNASAATDTAAAALTAYGNMTVPQPTEMSFANQPTQGTSDSFNMGQNSDFGLDALGNQQSAGDQSPSGPGSANKPAVGSEEWHKVRRDNHKEVERRRRETINEGINELAKIVPGCEKNKGSILQRAVQFITQLKENESQNIEKWTLEKLLTEQAINELSSSVDKHRQECSRAWEEVEKWKNKAERMQRALDEAGVTVEGVDEEENKDGEEGS